MLALATHINIARRFKNLLYVSLNPSTGVLAPVDDVYALAERTDLERFAAQTIREEYPEARGDEYRALVADELLRLREIEATARGIRVAFPNTKGRLFQHTRIERRTALIPTDVDEGKPSYHVTIRSEFAPQPVRALGPNAPKWAVGRDQDVRDPRWTANREARCPATSESAFLDLVAEQITGIPTEPVDDINPPLVEDESLPEAGPMTTRTAKVFRLLLDRTNSQVLVQRRHRYSIGSVSGFKTVHRYDASGIAGARWLALETTARLRARGDVVHTVEFDGKRRMLLVINTHSLIVRPDSREAVAEQIVKGSPAEVREAARRIYTTLKAQGVTVRFWDRQRVAA